jgi:hypothetical protein
MPKPARGIRDLVKAERALRWIAHAVSFVMRMDER